MYKASPIPYINLKYNQLGEAMRHRIECFTTSTPQRGSVFKQSIYPSAVIIIVMVVTTFGLQILFLQKKTKSFKILKQL